jgi:hypothetical protein
MPTTLTASVDGQPKRRILVHFVKKLGILLKLPKNDYQYMLDLII